NAFAARYCESRWDDRTLTDALLNAPDLLARVSPANLEANLQALAKAMGTWLFCCATCRGN
ncbi:hypothetical protein ACCQ08_25730, partial [Comamonas sp. SY3]|uniref:hypothetical protein n=1 Tax=Comamonas sp. SY3 TaxID=3243601 RepID=UPI003593FEAC